MLKDDLTALLNTYNAESPSNTPDWILAEYLMGCLAIYNHALKSREYEGNNDSSLPEQK